MSNKITKRSCTTKKKCCCCTPVKLCLCRCDGNGGNSNGIGKHVGEVFYYLGRSAPRGALVADGTLVVREDHPELWKHVQEKGLVVAEADWLAQAADQSSVGVFSDGDGATTFRLPKLQDYLRGVEDPQQVGTWQGDAIRNIVGWIDGYTSFVQADGAYTLQNKGLDNIVGSTSQCYHGATFNASRVVPTAEENRPKTIRLLVCVQAHDTTVSSGACDCEGKEDTIKRLPRDVTPLILYVRKDGNDDNDGLADTPDRAFATIARAVIATDGYDFPRDPVMMTGYVVISIGPGTYEEGVWFAGSRSRHHRIDFTATVPDQKPTLAPAVGGYGFINSGAVSYVSNIRVHMNGGSGFACHMGGQIYLKDVDVSGTGANAVWAARNASILFDGGATSVSGSWGNVFRADFSGVIQSIEPTTFQISVSLTSGTSAFASVSHTGTMYVPSCTFSGTCEGVRYRADTNAVIDTNNGGATYFPGTADGVVSSGGVYI